MHIAQLGEILQRVNLTDIKTPEAVIQKLIAETQNIEKGQWIIGQGWDEGDWANNYPDKTMLDKLFPDNPVYLRSLHSFAIWVNSKALEEAGINKDTADPTGGIIVRTDSGEPTGILLNRATVLVSSKLPKQDLNQRAEFIRTGLLQMAKDGYVAVHEAGANSLDIAAFQKLKNENNLPIRLYAMLSIRDEPLAKEWLDKGPYTDPDGFLDIRSVKAFYDGALGSRGARLLEDYSDMEGHRGVSGENYGFNSELATKLINEGFQLSIHAIGDAGNREVLALLAEQNSQLDLRHRIEHAQVIHPDDFQHFKSLNVIASMEPPHAVEDKTWAEARVGRERIKGAYAWRTIREAEIPLTFNSDLPGSDHNIFYGLHAAISRQDKQLNPPGGWYPEQNMSIEEAIRGYTNWSAFAAFREHQTGIIKKGYWADFTVMDIDPFKLSLTKPSAILDGKIKMTIVQGKIVYQE